MFTLEAAINPLYGNLRADCLPETLESIQSVVYKGLAGTLEPYWSASSDR